MIRKAWRHTPDDYGPDTSCPEYVGGYCKWLSQECGRAEYATAVRCVNCQGSKPDWLALHVLPTEHNQSFVSRTMAKQPAGPITVRVPAVWAEVERELITSGVLDSENVQAVYLTGSAIREGNDNPKDIDVALHLSDIAGWVAEGIELPRVIAGKRVDYWLHVKRSPLWPMLDCTEKVLYTPLHAMPGDYRGKDGIRVLPASFEDWQPEQRARLHGIVTKAKESVSVPPEPAPVNAGKGCGACTRAKRKPDAR